MATKNNNTGLFKPGNTGRPKGAVNKITRTVKEAVLEEFNAQQDNPDGDAKWPLRKFANKYPRDFYAMAAKLIPTEIRANINKIELHVIRTVGNTSNLIEDVTPEPEEGTGNGEAV